MPEHAPMRIPTAKGRGNIVHAQGEQQTLKPMPKESSLAINMNSGWPAIQTTPKGDLEQIPKWSLLLKKSEKGETGRPREEFAANQKKTRPNYLTLGVLTYLLP